jgi:hypothetical protein
VRVLAETLKRTPVSWRMGAKGPLQAEFAWVRVWPGYGHQAGRDAEDVPDSTARWLLVEWRTDGTIKYALSNLPAKTTLEQAVALWKSRWHVEQGYQQLKGRVRLDHFAGRSWAGFHHHATLTFLADGLLALEPAHGTPTTLDPEEPVLSPHGEAGRAPPALRPAVPPTLSAAFPGPPPARLTSCCRLPSPRCRAWSVGFN